jgi:hypothetical protein
MRPLYTIAQDIRAHWPNVHFSARPYLDAMGSMTSIDDKFGFDEGASVVLYFLGNAKTWRGPDAQRIKAELRCMLDKHRKARSA